MAKFTRAEIRAIIGANCTDEMENRLVALHLGVIDPLKDDVARYKADAEKLPTVQKELDDLKAAKKSGDATAQTELDALKKEFDAYKAQVTAKETLDAKKAAYKAICKDANLSEKGIEKALKYADFDKFELNDDGKLKNAADLLKGVSDEWGDYVSTPGKTGAQTATPPKGEPTPPEKPNRGAEIAKKLHEAQFGKTESTEE